jgi:predicted Zn finger-like uncharacterized protein
MDVRCEKCQTEYELDESRLKPAGVTVKCTNCGHMFKIRKRAPTNVGMPTAAAPVPTAAPPEPKRTRATSAEESIARPMTDTGSGPNAERQWLLRLENGDQKSCRELATLQQWIVAGVVTRESLISRSGKTWKRLGDIPELGQYFVIADEARTQRPDGSAGKAPSTMPGVVAKGLPSGGAATAPPARNERADQEDPESRATGTFPPRRTAQTSAPPPPARRTPSAGSPQARPNPLAQTELAPAIPQSTPRTGPSASDPPPRARPPSIPDGGRSTALWANSDIKASESMIQMPQGPQAGKIAAIPDEPAFAGRVRVQASDEASFSTGKVRLVDDDEYLLPPAHGSRAGLWIAIFSLLVIVGAAVTIYVFAFRDQGTTQAKIADAPAPIAVTKADAAAPPPPSVPDAAPAPVVTPIDAARGELATAVEARMRSALDALASQDDPPAQAMRSRLMTAIAQDVQDRAGLLEKGDGDKLRREAKQLVVDAASLAQRAVKAKPDDASANLAMAEVLRLQGKTAHEVRRYLEVAKTNAGSDAELATSAALANALLLSRDGKLDDAAKALAAIDGNDARVAVASALLALAQNRADDAKKALDSVLAQAPDQEAAHALQKKLETSVTKSDPLPPEDHAGSGSEAGSKKSPPPSPTPEGGGYDALVARGNKLAETNCAKAMEVFQKAIEIKSNGVDALVGMGYCHLDAKQFASAFSNFRSALVVAPRFEPALGGIAETYQRQGNKDMAIESWRKYLEVFPNAAKAKKQLEILGAPTDAPSPPPPPTPTPTPAPDGTGSGSG